MGNKLKYPKLYRLICSSRINSIVGIDKRLYNRIVKHYYLVPKKDKTEHVSIASITANPKTKRLSNIALSNLERQGLDSDTAKVIVSKAQDLLEISPPEEKSGTFKKNKLKGKRMKSRKGYHLNPKSYELEEVGR